MVNYANGKIYKMVNNVDDEIYVGSTCNPLHKRKNGHKGQLTRHPHLLKSQHFRRIGWENVKIILIENYPCESKQDLLKRERYWIDELKPSLNKALPYVSEEERVRHKKEYRLEYIKRDEVKVRHNEMNKIWMREYVKRPENKTHKASYDTEYRNRPDVKVKSLERQAIMITCECGKTGSKVKISRHLKSKQHQAWQKIYDFIHS